MKVAYQKNVWDKYHEKLAVRIDPLKNPSFLISGSSGSGKSYAVKWMMRNLLAEQKLDLYFCNYKDSCDFEFLKSYEKYYTGRDCEEGFLKFYSRFLEIQQEEKENISHMTILIFDEFPAFILRAQNEDKKLADKYLRMMADVLMFFRSYKGGCWVICQRADSGYFASGSRENFHNRLLLTRGRPSRESLQMLGFSKEDLADEEYKVGEGICYVDGQGLFQIKYPLYDEAKINEQILKYLECSPTGKA